MILLYSDWTYICLNRAKHQLDLTKAAADTVVITMYYAKNLTLPEVSDTPSGCYFTSLISVSMFSVYCEHDKMHFDFLYSKRKGTNEVATMLYHAPNLQGAFSSVDAVQRLHFLIISARL